MISVSNAFRTAVESTSRQFTARFLIDGNVLDCDIDNVKCYKGSCGNELAIGSVYASYIEATLKRCDTVLRNKELTYQVGLMVNGDYEYVTMGKYTVLDPKESNGSITFTAVSTISLKANQIYNAPYTHMTDIMTRLQAIAGVSIDYSDFTIYPYSETTKHLPADGTFRECIGIVGCLLGGFVTETTSGDIVIKKYNSGETVSILPYRCSSLPEFDTPYWIDGVKIIVKEADSSSAEESFEHGTPMIIQKCEYMSEGLFDAMYPNIEGLHFDVGKVKIALGDPCIEPWDILTVTDLKNDVHNVPCFEIVHTFNGGLETEVTAQVGSTDVNSKNVKGALEKAVERLGGDVLAAAQAAADAEDLATQAKASAEAAQSSADDAADAAQDAWDHADDAATAAQTAWNYADTANTAAQTAWNYADSANTAASTAWSHADDAYQSASNANTYANAALDQLGVVQDVIGVLDWASSHGSFTLTTDTTVQEGKVYFTYNSSTGDYEPVVGAEGNPRQKGYYDLSMDEAMQEFILAHLAVTQRGLWVLPNGMGSATNAQYAPNYKVLLSNDGMYVYDGAGVLVTTYGENITFSATRSQSIGNSNAGITFNPANGGSLTINGANITLAGGTSIDDEINSKAPLYGTCSTAAGTQPKVVVCGNAKSYYPGMTITVLFSTANTVLAPQLNVNQLGEKAIWVDGAVTSTSNCLLWNTNASITFMYDGSKFIVTDQPTTYYTTCSTAAGTTAKEATCAGCVIRKGTTVTAQMANAHTGSSAATLYVNGQSGTARTIYVNGATVTSTSGNSWANGEAVPFVFNGQYWCASRGEKGDNGVSVTSVTPYYILDTTTPTKPADDTQPTGWSTTQPSLDTAQICYVTVQSVFSNGHITYSAVSTLSEYEASKNTYNYAREVDGRTNRLNDDIHGEEGIADQLANLTGAVTIKPEEPSVFIQVYDENTGTVDSGVKITSSTVEFVQDNNPVAWIDSQANDGTIHIATAEIEDRIVIGNLEVFNLNGGIGIRRKD